MTWQEEHEFSGLLPVHWIQNKGRFPSAAPYKCGAMGVQASSNIDDVTCADCLYLLGRLRDKPKRISPPAQMNEGDDGMFTFHDVHIMNNELEVVPQGSGNVEITISYGGEGALFTLSHLDRANLVRALLHDFHYSPEVGGPADD